MLNNFGLISENFEDIMSKIAIFDHPTLSLQEIPVNIDINPKMSKTTENGYILSRSSKVVDFGSLPIEIAYASSCL